MGATADQGDFRIINVEVTGNIKITENTLYRRMKAQNITVEKGVWTKIYGSVTNSLILRENSVVLFYGTIVGRIIDEGGKLYYFEE